MIKIQSKQTGFTIIELMIASAIFAVILLLCSFSILQIGKTYYKGINATRTQATARAVSDNIAQSIQFSGSAPNPSPGSASGTDLTAAGTGAICIGTRRYSYIKDRVLVSGAPNGTETNTAIVVDDAPPGGSCTPAFGSGGRELLSNNMRVTQLRIENTPGGYEVSVGITAGPRDLSDGTGGVPFGQCEGGPSSQFCAYSQLVTLAKQRL